MDKPQRRPRHLQQHHHLQASDLRALSQLAVQASSGLSRVVEGMHQSIWQRLGRPGRKQARPGQAAGLTGLVFRSIQGGTQLVGKGLDAALLSLEPWLAKAQGNTEPSPEREAFVAALNGVLGDHLQASNNPLATPMSLRWQGQVLQEQTWPRAAQVGDKLLLMIHGLCMNDLQWQRADDGAAPRSAHAEALCAAGGLTPLYLRYNSGLHIEQNGHLLAAALEQLLARWPRPVAEIQVLAHSMGGLLIRSAHQAALRQGLQWPARLRRISFLGTPHHGAPLERAGGWLDLLLGSSSLTAPLAKLGQVRSAGITDLRHGSLNAQSLHIPLPEGVDCCVIAATLAPKRGLLADRLVGDGLVPLHSALGQHDDTARCLHFAPTRQWVAYRMNHMALMHDPAVTARLLSCPPRQNSCRPDKSNPGGGDEGREWLDTDKHLRTRL